jgi:hypothetical protein
MQVIYNLKIKIILHGKIDAVPCSGFTYKPQPERHHKMQYIFILIKKSNFEKLHAEV